MKVVSTNDRGFQAIFRRVCNRSLHQNGQVERNVRSILQAVGRNGDAAVVRYAKKFDGVRLKPSEFLVRPQEIKQAHSKIGKKEGDALRFAARRIRKFHKRQRASTWIYREQGIRLGQLITPLDVVGLYVPGGKALYPSTVLMNAIPAKVAGVPRVIMCTPTMTGTINPYILVAADIAGIDQIYRVGGVQSIGAMAFGTDTIPKADKIVGPGNLYVAIAKRVVFGIVGIDMIAGPSELLIIADETANPSHVAADLLCEAEHDEEARVYLVTPSSSLAKAVVVEIKKQLAKLSRERIAAKSIQRHAIAFVVPDMKKAVEVSNAIAPEHLEIVLDRAFDYLDKIRNAGALFLGRHTPPAVADYVAGPNHVLPTNGSARFFSALSVNSFVKQTNVIAYDKKGLQAVKPYVTCLANMEGLQAHARSMESRSL